MSLEKTLSLLQVYNINIMNVNTNSIRIHQGNNLRKLREAQRINQKEISERLGLSPKLIVEYENKEKLEENTLANFSKALNVPIEVIKNLENNLESFIVGGNTIESYSSSISIFGNNITSYPIDRIIELEKEKEILFERLLKLEQDRNDDLNKNISNLKTEIDGLRKYILNKENSQKSEKNHSNLF